MTSRIVIVASIEQSTMVSTWTEHLCLHRTAEGKWCLDIRGYEIAGEAREYENEEGTTYRSSICKPCQQSAMVGRVEPGGVTNAAYQTSRLRLRFASRTSTDWNWRNGDDWRCRSRHTRGPSSLHARCYAALFRIRFGRVANDEVHDGQEGTVESVVPRRDGTQGLPSRLSAL